MDFVKVTAILGLDASQFKKEFSQVDDLLGGWPSKLAKVGTALGAAFLAKEAIEGLVNITREAGKAAEAVENMAQAAGVSTSFMQGMTYTLEAAGLGSDGASSAFRILSQRMVEAQNITSATAETFRQLNIVVGHGLSTEQILLQAAVAFSKMEDGAQKTAYAVQLFGRNGAQLIPILNQGAAGLDAAMRKARELGVVLDEKSIKALKETDDAFDRLTGAVTGFKNTLAVAISGPVKGFLDAMTWIITHVPAASNAISVNAGAIKGYADKTKSATAAANANADAIAKAQVEQAKANAETAKGEKIVADTSAAYYRGVAASEKYFGENLSAIEDEIRGESASTDQFNAMMAARIEGHKTVIASDAELAARSESNRREDVVAELAANKSKADMAVSLAQSTYQETDVLRTARIAQIDADAAYQIATTATTEESILAIERDALARKVAIAQQYPTFFEKQMLAIVNSNSFSIAQITQSWTSGLANAIVTGTDFVKQAWQATQVAIVQGVINTGVQLAAQWALQASVEMGILEATEAAKLGLKTSTNTAIVASEAGAATASVSIWAGASAAIVGFYATVAAGFATISASLILAVTAVGTFVMGVLSAIAAALTATVFGIPWAGAILVGVAAIAAALAATDNLPKLAEGGIVTGPTLALIGEAGPEAVVPLDGSHGFGGEQTIIIELDGRTIARNVLEHMPREIRVMGVPV